MKFRPIYLFAVAALCTGCFKDVSFKTNYILKPQVRIAAGAPTTPLADFKAFAYAVDTTNWTVSSYQDAVDGIITSKLNPAEKISNPIATAEPYEQEGVNGGFRLSIANPSQMVLGVDLQNSLYAYTQQKLGENLSYLYVSLVFQPWKEGVSYKEGGWSYYNQFYIAPTYVDFFVDPKAQAEEGGDPAAIALLKAYAFAADSTTWFVASYEDAAAGVLTLKSDTTMTFTNSIPATAEQSGLYRLRVSTPSIMVVVTDRTNKRYAYSQQSVVVDPEATPATAPITFRLWMEQYLYVEDGWRVVNPALKPEKPENPLIPASKRRR